MTIAIVQPAGDGTTFSNAFASVVTPGNTIVCLVAARSPGGNYPAGFTVADEIATAVIGGDRGATISYYTVPADPLLRAPFDGKTFISGRTDDRAFLLELSGVTDVGEIVTTIGSSLTPDCGGPITPDTSFEAFIVGVTAFAGFSTSVTPDDGVIELGDASVQAHHWSGYRAVPVPSGPYSIAGTFNSTSEIYCGVTVVFRGAATTPGTIDAPPPFEDPPPAGVLLEIYAAEPGAARWDVALWDEAVWSSSGWQDVTPQGVEIDITWGSNRPELGILSVPIAASWAVDFYDPDRVLDPSNEDGPYFGDLEPFLPVRVSHRGTIVRVGYATGIGRRFARVPLDGYIRATDNVSRLANAAVPPDTELADTLYARARDAIAAAGLSVEVAVPIGTDPPVSPWLTGTREWSAWQWIADAAQEVLHIPIVDRLGVLTFRPWAVPLYRGRGITSAELVDLQVITDYAGMYSVVQAREDVDTVIERRLTPPPRYGARTITRDEITIDPDLWAEAVLTDRSFPALRWIPGNVRPLTAVRVEQLATIEAVERIGLAATEQDPPVSIAGVVVGGEIAIRGRADAEAVWSFVYHTAQGSLEPLIETGGAPTDYLLATGGGEFLYPTTGG